MRINELYNPIKEAMDNGYGNLEVYVKEFSKPSEQTMNPIEFVNIVSSYSNGEKESFAEIVYKNYSHDEKEDKSIQYSVGYTQQLADEVQSYRHERQLIFDAWKKSNKESAEMIKDMLNLMKHKMKPCDTEKCQSEFDNIRHRAESYLEHMNDDIDLL